MDLNDFKTNQVAEEKGTWVDFGNECELLIARSGNKQWRKHWKKISKPYEKQITRKTLSDEKADVLIIDAMANTILLGWKNLMNNGEVIVYSVSKAKEVLQIKDFREAVSEVSTSMESFQVQLDEEDTEDL